MCTVHIPIHNQTNVGKTVQFVVDHMNKATQESTSDMIYYRVQGTLIFFVLDNHFALAELPYKC